MFELELSPFVGKEDKQAALQQQQNRTQKVLLHF